MKKLILFFVCLAALHLSAQSNKSDSLTNSQMAGVKFKQSANCALTGVGLTLLTVYVLSKTEYEFTPITGLIGAGGAIYTVLSVVRFYEGSNLLIKGNGIVVKF